MTKPTIDVSLSDDSIPLIETDVLIVGAGPAGASLGCFLGYNGNLMSLSSVEGTEQG